ncbi:hypothetical protein MASR2M117_05990 [Paludibacter sp.]
MSLAFSLNAQEIDDDIYFKPSDVNKAIVSNKNKSVRPNYKNGAKEIIYLNSKKENKIIFDNDTVYILSANDGKTSSDEQTDSIGEEGYYLNGFKGSDIEYEYAERIRRFHNPKFTIHISDPQFTDIYFLDNYNWNVYVDGSYAWVTPTWTNPYWNNYYWSPYSYNSWYWRSNWYGWHSPYYYDNWYYSYPWNYGYYGGHYGGYYGWNSPYYHSYYYGGWGYPHYGHNMGYYPGWNQTVVKSNKNHSEAYRRKEYYNKDRISSVRSDTHTRIAGGSYSSSVNRNPIISEDRQRITNVDRGSNSQVYNSRTTTRTNTISRSTESSYRPSVINNQTRITNSGSYINNNNSNNRVTQQTTTSSSSSAIRTGTGSSNNRITTQPSTSRSSSYSSPTIRSSSPSTSSSSYSTPSSSSRSSYSSPSSSYSGSSSSSSSSSSRSSSGGSRR